MSAFAALMSLGDAAPPAPRLFIAPQIPGAEKLARPRIVILYAVERYHFTGVYESYGVNPRIPSRSHLDAIDPSKASRPLRTLAAILRPTYCFLQE